MHKRFRFSRKWLNVDKFCRLSQSFLLTASEADLQVSWHASLGVVNGRKET